MRERRGTIDMPTGNLTHEDLIRDAWVRAGLSVVDLERALEAYWDRGVLPDWYMT